MRILYFRQMIAINDIKVIILPSILIYVFIRAIGLIGPFIILLAILYGIISLADNVVKSYENEVNYYSLHI